MIETRSWLFYKGGLGNRKNFDIEIINKFTRVPAAASAIGLSNFGPSLYAMRGRRKGGRGIVFSESMLSDDILLSTLLILLFKG